MSKGPVETKEQFLRLDSNEQGCELYARAGLALYYGQVLEHAAVNLLAVAAIANGKVKSSHQFDDALAYGFAKTLGRLLRELPPGLLAAEESGIVKEALQMRNALMHHAFREHATDLLNAEGRWSTLVRFRGGVELFQQADKVLTAATFRVGSRFGLTQERWEDEFRNLRADTSAL